MTQPLNIRDRSILEAYTRSSVAGSIDGKGADALIAAAAQSKTRQADLDLILTAEKGKGLTAEAERKIRQALGATTPRPAPAMVNAAKPTTTTTVVPRTDLRWLPQARFNPPALPQHEFRPATAEQMREGRRRHDAMVAQQRIQASVNAVAQTDPFAARVNGVVQGPDGNWSKVASSPLEIAGMAAVGGTLPGQVYGAIQAGQALHGAMEKPSVGSIAKAVVKTGLMAGGLAHTAHLSHSAALEVGLPMAEGLALAESHRPGGLLKKKAK